MKTLATAILLSLGVAAGAQAADTNTQPLTRAQVQAELAQAKATGQYSFGDLDYPPTVAAQGPSLSRAEVQAQLAQAKAAGLVTYGEEDYPATVADNGSHLTRAQVQAELAEAKASGNYSFGDLDYPPSNS